MCCYDDMGTIMMLLSTLLLVEHEVCAPVCSVCSVCLPASRQMGHCACRVSCHVYPHDWAVSPVNQADLHLQGSIMLLILHVSMSLGGCLYPCPGDTGQLVVLSSFQPVLWPS